MEGRKLVPWIVMLVELQAWLVRGSLSTVALFVTIEESGNADAVVDLELAGALVSAYFLGYSILLVPAGFAAQLFGGHRTLALSICGIALALLLAPLFGRGGLIVCIFMCGACASPLMPGKSVILSNWFTKSEIAEALTIVKSGNLFGKIASGSIAVGIAGRFGWRAVLQFNGFSALLVLAAWLVLLRESPESSSGSHVQERKKNDHRSKCHYYRS